VITAIIIMSVLSLLVSLGTFALGRATTKRIEYQYPDCAHVWGKWKQTHVVRGGAPTKEVWGQVRQCEICEFSEWKRGTN
jgi:hypothetical protein